MTFGDPKFCLYLAGAQDEAATALSVPKWFAALTQGIDAFEACLSAHGVEYRRIYTLDRSVDFGERDGVKFAVGDEHWVAEFYTNGKFKQLAWT